MRNKIWSDQTLQCSIVGTCLSLKELRKLARRAKVEIEANATEFEVHATFVRLCKEPCAASKAVNKCLDKKYSGAVRSSMKLTTDDELALYWDERKGMGDIPGPYWALMTHPCLSEDLKARIYGDVHMLSHLVGASNRADLRRLFDLQQQLEQRREQQAKFKRVYKQQLQALSAEKNDLARRLIEAEQKIELYRGMAEGSDPEVMLCKNTALQHSLQAQREITEQEHSRSRELARKADAYKARCASLEDELRERRAESEFLEQEVSRLLMFLSNVEGDICGESCSKAGTAECPGPDLCGKRILYVGGRTNLVQHYRRVVERHGGEFLHHDGGMESATVTLSKMVCSADAVLCPVDCVSHDACLRVKKVCKYSMKPYKMMRSSGLSSLVRSLGEMQGRVGEHEGVYDGEKMQH